MVFFVKEKTISSDWETTGDETGPQPTWIVLKNKPLSKQTHYLKILLENYLHNFLFPQIFLAFDQAP